MAQNCVTVVEIGSSKLSCVIAERGLNGTYIVKAKASTEYAGFFEGEFIESGYLYDAVQSLFSQISSTYKKKIKKVYVGIPAEFSKVVVCEEQMNFKFKHSINEKDINFLYNQASENHRMEDMEIVSVNPISFKIDDNRWVANPVGEVANSLSAQLSIIYGGKEFIELFNNIIAGLGFSSVEYISEPLAEALFVITKELLEDSVIL